jgi:hypothetical protein
LTQVPAVVASPIPTQMVTEPQTVSMAVRMISARRSQVPAVVAPPIPTQIVILSQIVTITALTPPIQVKRIQMGMALEMPARRMQTTMAS